MNVFCRNLVPATIKIQKIAGIHPDLRTLLQLCDIEPARYRESPKTLSALIVCQPPLCRAHNGALHVIAGWPIVCPLLTAEHGKQELNIRVWTGQSCWRYRDLLMTDIFSEYIEQKRCGIRKRCISTEHVELIRSHLRVSEKSIWSDTLREIEAC